MPYRIIRQTCTDQNGNQGDWTLQVKEDGAWSFHSCHQSRASAFSLRDELEESEE